MHRRGLTCWDQGPSLGLPRLWVSLPKDCKGAQGEPHTRLEDAIQVLSGGPRTTTLSVPKFFPSSRREPTRRDPGQF